ncbi:MAG: GNAT family N-acetyltransferase [bacterium]|nr:GNAT family N-acetyltransferase [bacterium]
MFEGNLTRLRACREEDVPLAQQFISDPEVSLNMVPDIPYPMTLGEERKWYESLSARGDRYSFAIETREETRYIGGCGVNNINWKNGTAEVGIFIGDPEFRDKGCGTDALGTPVRFAFGQIHINKLKLNVFSFNARAICCYEKLNFKLEGVLRQEIFRDVRYHDIHIMSILREEYVS